MLSPGALVDPCKKMIQMPWTRPPAHSFENSLEHDHAPSQHSSHRCACSFSSNIYALCCSQALPSAHLNAILNIASFCFTLLEHVLYNMISRIPLFCFISPVLPTTRGTWDRGGGGGELTKGKRRSIDLSIYRSTDPSIYGAIDVPLDRSIGLLDRSFDLSIHRV